MEARAEYLGRVERPRLSVVKDDGGQPRFSALLHDVIRKTDLSRDARLLVAVIQMYDWKDGECRASHATMAADMGCSTRMLRAYLTELIEAGILTERDAGTRRQKVYRLVAIGSIVPIEPPVNEQSTSDSDRGNRKFSTVQSEVFDTSNRKPASDSKKKTPVKKKKEEDRSTAPTEPARRSTRSGELIDLLGAADVPVTMRAQDHKALKESGADPVLVAEVYGAIFRGEWGDDFMQRRLTVQSAIGHLAGYQAWRNEMAVEPPPANGTISKLTPATDDDRAVWGRALDGLRTRLAAGNVDTYLAPLEVAGRGEDGGLWLVVSPSVAEHTARFRAHISRALEDAGDRNPAAVRFKARRTKGRADAE